MSKNMSIYIPAELAERMTTFPEVNWSEIVRIAIEDYVNNRHKSKVDYELVNQKISELEVLKQELTSEITTRRNSLSIFDYKHIPLCSYWLVYYPEEKKIKINFRVENTIQPVLRLDRIIYDFKLVKWDTEKEIIRIRGAYLKKRRLTEFDSDIIEIEYDVGPDVKLKIDELFESEENPIETRNKVSDNLVYFENELGNFMAFLVPLLDPNGQLLYLASEFERITKTSSADEKRQGR